MKLGALERSYPRLSHIMQSFSNSEDDNKVVASYEKTRDAFVSTKEVDTAAELAAGAVGQLDPKEAQRIRCVARPGLLSPAHLPF